MDGSIAHPVTWKSGAAVTWNARTAVYAACLSVPSRDQTIDQPSFAREGGRLEMVNGLRGRREAG
jgi:hypothetical protein